MKAVLQRVERAELQVAGEVRASIGAGLVALVGIERGDGGEDVRRMADRIANLRFFTDEQGKMNRSILDVGGEALLVPNFTLAGSTRKGRRPSFDGALPPEEASAMFEALCAETVALGVRVQTGVFQAHMRVELVNDGPVTLLVDTRGSEG